MPKAQFMNTKSCQKRSIKILKSTPLNTKQKPPKETISETASGKGQRTLKAMIIKLLLLLLLTRFSRVRLCATQQTAAHRGPLSLGLSRQEYWSGLPCPSLGDLPNPGIKLGSPALQVNSLPAKLSVLISPWCLKHSLISHIFQVDSSILLNKLKRNFPKSTKFNCFP